MMTVDLSAFSEEKFDPKRWINAACGSRDPQDPVDKHLADLEMKLQLLSEEIATSLDEQSESALLRIPRSTRDVVRLRDDASSLRSAVSVILQRLKKVHPAFSPLPSSRLVQLVNALAYLAVHLRR